MSGVILGIAGLYFLVSLTIGLWVARSEKNLADDYFLAGRKLPWYAISMSMTGSNIGTEHFIGMVGTAYAFGLAPATFEWCNFIAFSMLAFIFLPYFFRKRLYTVPEFLEKRYAPSTRAVYAVLSLFHMVLAVLVPALYAGGRIVYELVLQQELTALSWPFIACILLISCVTAAYCIYGGLLSVVWTDVLQVAVLLGGGLLLIILGVANAGGIQEVIEANRAASASRFQLINEASHPVSPWTGVATIWLTLSLWYVATNQFYVQRCLGARSEWDAKMGVLGAGYIKLFLPFIIVFPGLVAFALYGPGLSEDAVYVRMVTELLPPAGQGLLLAALIAAIMSTVSSVLNSSSTIWSMDIHRRLINPKATQEQIVKVGRWSTFIIIVLGTLMAPLLLYWEGGIFIYIQDMAAFFAPPIALIFLLAYFWPKGHGHAATVTLIIGIIVGIFLRVYSTRFGINWLEPLLMRAAVSWVICLVVFVVASLTLPIRKGESPDPDIQWRLSYAQLPADERAHNRGFRNLAYWWAGLVAISVLLFIIFW